VNREFHGVRAWAIKIIAISFTIFQLYTAGFGFLPDMQQRAVHVAFGLTLTFALIPPVRSAKPNKKIPVYDLILIGVGIVGCANAFFKYEIFLLEYGLVTTEDFIIGTCLTVLILEAGRRTTGWAFPGLTLFLLI